MLGENRSKEEVTTTQSTGAHQAEGPLHDNEGGVLGPRARPTLKIYVTRRGLGPHHASWDFGGSQLMGKDTHRTLYGSDPRADDRRSVSPTGSQGSIGQ